MRFIVRFPLGVYFAQTQTSFAEPEWPPHPIRLVGALLAAAHSPARRASGSASLNGDLELLSKLCHAPPPAIAAPEAAPLGAGRSAEAVAWITGVARWAPRNYFTKGGREQAAVEKVGVVIGDRPIQFVWREMELSSAELARLSSLAREIAFLGTSRSPVLVEVQSGGYSPSQPTWEPVADHERPAVSTEAVRVPDPATMDGFERRHRARRSSSDRVERATTAVPGIRLGREVGYVHSTSRAATHATNPTWWGDMIVLAVDRERSEVIPRSSASYLLARAVRTALLGAYGAAGESDEAPAILRARGADPHCAIVPLADVWHEGARGEIKGVAVILPSAERIDTLARQRRALEHCLATLVGDTDLGVQRYVQIPGAGRVWLRMPTAGEAALKTLLKRTYRTAATSWVSVTPVVHARWRKGPAETVIDQVGRDCSHVGLPKPTQAQPIRGSTFPGTANRPVPTHRVPQEWRKSLGGPTGHLRMTFESPVMGPVLLGRARHFGLGLFVPDSGSATGSRDSGA